MIIDTHCHYNAQPIFSEIEKHWKNSLDHKVVGGICIGTDLENSKIALDLAQKFSSMFASIAIHPEEITEKIKLLVDGDKYSQESIDQVIADESKAFERLLVEEKNKNNSKLIAIGEIGLDYYRLKSKGLKRNLGESMQRQIFSKQLILAFKYNLPVILHVRDQIDRKEVNAYYDVYEIVSQLISKYEQENKSIPPIILHCASGPLDYIKKFIKLGAYFGFAGNITYDNAPELREILQLAPKEKILLETDAPYLAPNQNKGEICQPYYITQTARFLRDTYHIDLDIILANTLKIFPKFQEVIQ